MSKVQSVQTETYRQNKHIKSIWNWQKISSNKISIYIYLKMQNFVVLSLWNNVRGCRTCSFCPTCQKIFISGRAVPACIGNRSAAQKGVRAWTFYSCTAVRLRCVKLPWITAGGLLMEKVGSSLVTHRSTSRYHMRLGFYSRRIAWSGRGGVTA